MAEKTWVTDVDDSSWPDLLPPVDQVRAAWGRWTGFWPGCPGVPSLLTLDQVDRIVRDGRARYPQVAALTGGLPAPLGSYTTSRSVNGSAVAGFVDLAAVRRILAAGGSLHLNDLQSHHDGLARLCAALTARTGLPFSAMAFLSPPGRSAFVLHGDPLHVLVLQTYGRKTWDVFPPVPRSDSGPVEEAAVDLPERQVTLSSGDVLYIPPGRPHRAVSCGDWSLHLSLVTAPLSGRRLLETVLSGLLKDGSGELPIGWFDTDAAAAALRELADGVADGLRSTDWAAVLRDIVTPPPPNPGRLTDLRSEDGVPGAAGARP
jgi:hypothetical protein